MNEKSFRETMIKLYDYAAKLHNEYPEEILRWYKDPLAAQEMLEVELGGESVIPGPDEIITLEELKKTF
ncbi:MAG TPA: hypothetical protein P5098_01940 [Candidatus Dojkabacteria bacterium]|nr:hypothetical protein [Candidatus Dojkabacteria bacterium]